MTFAPRPARPATGCVVPACNEGAGCLGEHVGRADGHGAIDAPGEPG